MYTSACILIWSGLVALRPNSVVVILARCNMLLPFQDSSKPYSHHRCQAANRTFPIPRDTPAPISKLVSRWHKNSNAREHFERATGWRDELIYIGVRGALHVTEPTAEACSLPID